MMTAWTVNTNANLFFDKKKRELANIQASLHFYCYDNFGKKERSMHRIGMAAIPKFVFLSFPLLRCEYFIF